jgi:CHAT domain-containing protein/tetratricopeptide (TPR) repeat protein
MTICHIFALLILIAFPRLNQDLEIGRILTEGLQLFQEGKLQEAEKQCSALLQLARDRKNGWGEAEAHRCLGMIFNARADFSRGLTELEAALELHKTTGDQAALGRTYNALGYNEWARGNRARAREVYLLALAEFEAAGEKEEIARAHYNLAFTAPTREETDRWIPQALESARAAANKQLEGGTLHLWGDLLFGAGDYRQAIGKLQAALRLLEEANAPAQQARVHLSLGRLFRAHFRPEKAIEQYRFALESGRQRGDRMTVLQCLRSMGLAYDDWGKEEEALRTFEQALAIAREIGAPKPIYDATLSYANALNKRDRYREALHLAETLSPMTSDHARQNVLCVALWNLGEYQAAADAETAALADAMERGMLEGLYSYYLWRARCFDKLGRLPEALADIRSALASVESNRSKLIPTDYLKRGVSEGRSGLYQAAVDLLHRGGLPAEAFEVAEKARARAFVDLVASRELQLGIDDPITEEASEALPTDTVGLAGLRSAAAVPAATASEARQIASRLDSTLLCYWVGSESTYVWIVPPEGEIQSTRIEATEEHLKALVLRSAASGLGVTRGAETGVQLTARSGKRLDVSAAPVNAWSDLYRLLVEPVESRLPQKPGSSVIIVPHGPLFHLSFGALKNSRNRYLIEDLTLDYTPSIALLALPSQRNQGGGSDDGDYLLVADPRQMPRGADGTQLPALPGAQMETQAIAGLLRGASFTLLIGDQADEAAVRAKLAHRHVIHFATHGVLIDAEPLQSYLALGRIDESAAADGRLTAAEIYSLKLDADLVVLSACRSALGAVTGDGVNGLARAFFCAGTNTVIATMWDVPDQPTSRLVSSFYRHYRDGGGKSTALRSAQLELLKALRQGEISVETPLGPVTLPENPILWAGFVTIGRP